MLKYKKGAQHKPNTLEMLHLTTEFSLKERIAGTQEQPPELPHQLQQKQDPVFIIAVPHS